MRINQKERNIGTEVFWGKIVTGALFICTGICGIYHSIVWSALQLVFLSAAVILMIWLRQAKFEVGDEMSEYNLMVSKARASDILHMVFNVASVLAMWTLLLMEHNGSTVGLPRIFAQAFFFLMGAQDLLTGLFFRRLEAE